MGNRGGLNLYQLQPGFIIQQFMPEGYRARAKMHAEKKMFKGVRKIWNASRICVSSLRRGHANLLCIVPILVYVFRGIHLESVYFQPLYHNHFTCQLFFHTL